MAIGGNCPIHQFVGANQIGSTLHSEIAVRQIEAIQQNCAFLLTRATHSPNKFNHDSLSYFELSLDLRLILQIGRKAPTISPVLVS